MANGWVGGRFELIGRHENLISHSRVNFITIINLGVGGGEEGRHIQIFSSVSVSRNRKLGDDHPSAGVAFFLFLF